MKFIVCILLFLSSCIYDKIYKITTFINRSELNLTIIYGYEKITDTLLFYGTKYMVEKNTSTVINGHPINEANSSVTFFLFNSDTLNKRIKLGIIKDIMIKSFIKKLEVNSDSLKAGVSIIYL